MKKLLTILSILVIVSCTKTIEKQVDKNISNSILIQKMPDDIPNFDYYRQKDSVNQSLIVIEQLVENEKARNIDFHKVEILNNCDCTLDSNIIRIKLSNNGGWVYRELNLAVTDSLFAKHIYGNDICFRITQPQYIKLELSKLKPSLDEEIFGKILSIYDTTYYQVKTDKDTGFVDLKITEKFFGYFKCKVKKQKEERPWYLSLYGF